MNKKISDLAAATAPTGVEYFEILQGGVNKKVTGTQLITLSQSNVIDGEVPTGDIDDVNDTFTLASNPLAASVKVFLNGIRLKVTDDYTVSGAIITFLTPPTTGDILLVDYRT